MEREMASGDELATYLNDHLTGATAARDLIDRCASDAEGSALGTFLGTLKRDIEEDRETLRSIMRSLDVDEQSMKQVAGAVAERVSRLKFDVVDRSGGVMNRVLELESMRMGIEGKAALWRALQVIAPREQRLAEFDLSRLLARAEQQQQSVEEHRIELVRDAYR
jgi:hypothetical protein